jgi:hypothetical protein
MEAMSASKLLSIAAVLLAIGRTYCVHLGTSTAWAHPLWRWDGWPAGPHVDSRWQGGRTRLAVVGANRWEPTTVAAPASWREGVGAMASGRANWARGGELALYAFVVLIRGGRNECVRTASDISLCLHRPAGPTLRSVWTWSNTCCPFGLACWRCPMFDKSGSHKTVAKKLKAIKSDKNWQRIILYDRWTICKMKCGNSKMWRKK